MEKMSAKLCTRPYGMEKFVIRRYPRPGISRHKLNTALRNGKNLQLVGAPRLEQPGRSQTCPYGTEKFVVRRSPRPETTTAEAKHAPTELKKLVIRRCPPRLEQPGTS